MAQSDFNSKQSIFKIVKWILAVFFLFAFIGAIAKGNFIASILFLLLGLLLLPPISEQVKQKFIFWQSKNIRYIGYSVLFLIAVLSDRSGLTETSKNKSVEEVTTSEPYQEYISQVDKNIAELSKEKKVNREKLLADLKANSVYQKLITNKEVSAEYLPVLNAIANGISMTNAEGFSVNETLNTRVANSNNGEDKIKFAIKVVALSIPNINGGLPKEYIDLFERYKNKFKIYGEEMVMYDMDKKATKIEYNYDLTPFFVMLEPKNKEVLNQFFEAKNKGLSDWNAKAENYTYPYIATKDAYISYIKEVNPESPFIPKVDIEITASELYQAYEANEVSADEQYKGKKIAVTGIIDNIGKDVLDNPYVSMRIGVLQSVTCYFSDDNVKVISQLSKGQKITIIGECSGLSLTNVVIQDCELWE